MDCSKSTRFTPAPWKIPWDKQYSVQHTKHGYDGQVKNGIAWKQFHLGEDMKLLSSALERASKDLAGGLGNLGRRDLLNKLVYTSCHTKKRNFTPRCTCVDLLGRGAITLMWSGTRSLTCQQFEYQQAGNALMVRGIPHSF